MVRMKMKNENKRLQNQLNLNYRHREKCDGEMKKEIYNPWNLITEFDLRKNKSKRIYRNM